MIGKILGWFIGLPIDRILSSIDKRMDAGVKRDEIKGAAIQSFVNAQVAVMNGPGWWFMALFLFPLGAYWTSVLLYSVLWCRGCVWPQPWTIAALPPPMDEWAGWMVSGVFVVKGGEMLWRRMKA